MIGLIQPFQGAAGFKPVFIPAEAEPYQLGDLQGQGHPRVAVRAPQPERGKVQGSKQGEKAHANEPHPRVSDDRVLDKEWKIQRRTIEPISTAKSQIENECFLPDSHAPVERRYPKVQFKETGIALYQERKTTVSPLGYQKRADLSH